MSDKPIPLSGKAETVPPAHTYYFDITLDKGLPHETGVFFPEKYQAGSQVDLIIYLAGIDIGGLRNYWSAKRSYTLRESLNASGGNYVLVVPTVSVQGEQGAKFTTVGELAKNPERYLKQVICGISQQDPFNKGWKETNPTPRKIIVAGHSGGGFDLPKLALAIKGGKLGHLCECWGFDCLYFGNTDEWVALGRTGVPVYHYYLKKKVMSDGKETLVETTTSLNAAALQKKTASLANVQFIELRDVPGAHYWIPTKHLVERVQGIKCDL
jgi:hypothetical protein